MKCISITCEGCTQTMRAALDLASPFAGRREPAIRAHLLDASTRHRLGCAGRLYQQEWDGDSAWPDDEVTPEAVARYAAERGPRVEVTIDAAALANAQHQAAEIAAIDARAAR